MAASSFAINVVNFGAVGDGVTDDTAAIQAAIDYVQTLQYRPAITIPHGKYKITTGLTITADSVHLIGAGGVSLGGNVIDTPVGVILRYYGTGTALTIGVAPGASIAAVVGVSVQNFRIEVDDDATGGMYVWHANRCYFSNISIYGNKGTGRTGLHIAGGISNIYERFDINGIGRTPGATSADYVEMGLKCSLGYLNDSITTTVFRRCYFHYCNYAAKVAYSVDFEDCVFEASAIGVGSLGYLNSQFSRCWWEANALNLEVSAGWARFVGGRMNSGALQVVVGYVQSVLSMSFDGVYFSSTHATPLMFQGGNSVAATKGRVEFRNCVFPAAVNIGGTANLAVNGYNQVANKSMEVDVLRYTALAVTGSVTPAMNTDGGGLKYVVARAGHLLGLRALTTGALTGGTYNTAVLVNGAAVAQFTLAAQTGNVNRDAKFFENALAVGDVITAYLNTATLTSTTDFIFEVVIAYGPDGTP